MTSAGHAFGTTLKLAGNTIAELTNIGGMEISLETVDVTSHQSANAYREFIGGLLDTGEIAVEGNFYPGDATGQIALRTLQDTRATGAFIVTLPTAFATTWTFNAFVTMTKTGDQPIDGAVPFSASLKPTGKPVLAITASVNMTACVVTFAPAGTAYQPVFAAATYSYVITATANGATYTVTPTFAAGICTLTDATGATQQILSTVASGSLTAPADATYHTIYIDIKETGKMATRYTLHIMVT